MTLHALENTTQADTELHQFISLVATMNRLLLGLGSIDLFKRAEVGFGEWIAEAKAAARQAALAAAHARKARKLRNRQTNPDGNKKKAYDTEI